MNGGPCCQWWCKEQVTEGYLLPLSACPPLSPLSQMPYKLSVHIVVGQQSPWNADSKVYIKLSLSPSISSPTHQDTSALQECLASKLQGTVSIQAQRRLWGSGVAPAGGWIASDFITLLQAHTGSLTP